jgi:hypothetical protein
MRFLFGGDRGPDQKERRAFLARVDEAVANVAAELSSRDEHAIDRAQALLAEIDSHLELEISNDRDGARLVIVGAGEDPALLPLAETVVARFPSLDGHRLSNHRPPRTLSEALEEVARLHGRDLTGARARAGFSRGHLLDVVVYAQDFGGRGDDASLAAAEHAARCLLGDRVLDDWVGDIAAEPLPRGGPLRVLDNDAAPTFPLGELPAAIAAAVEGIKAGLPEPARSEVGRDGWTLFEVEPEPAHDYASQDDVALTSSALPEMLKCFLEGAPFSSIRFTRGAEKFAYLKLDVHDSSFEERLSRRNALEERLAEALGRRGLGAVVGNGLGLRYVYLDLALSPGRAGVELTCEVARSLDVPERSWLLFFDSAWAREWVGVWPQTVVPPGV